MSFLRSSTLSITFFCLMVALCSCASVGRVQPGEKVLVDYTCRLENGEIAATTIERVYRSDDNVKSNIFLKPEALHPLEIESAADGNEEGFPGVSPKAMPMESEIENQLQRLVVGMPIPGHGSLELRAEFQEKMHAGSRYLKLAKVRTREKIRQLLIGRYTQHFTGEPKIGDSFVFQQVFNATVIDVNEPYFSVQLTAIEGAVYQTPFGNGSVIDKGTHFEIPLDIEMGHVFRIGKKVGRISSISDDYFTVDFGHPFGGEVLYCDVDVNPVGNK